MTARAAAIVLLCAIAAGCGTKLNQAAFGVASDLPLAMLDGATVLVPGATPQAQRSFSFSAGDQTVYLPGMVVAFTVGDRLPQADVTIIGTLGGNEVVRRRARVTLLPEQTRFSRLALEARCVGVLCADDQTCIEGACQPVDVDLSRALPYAAGEESNQACDDPMFRFTSTDLVLPAPTGGCAAGQTCSEGTCYQPAGAPPVAGAGQFAVGSLGDYQL